ncbi:lecithin retinol acyltransferase family protein [Butyrivibrio sp. AC2005]|uniref:lecithin retinol acyltransferase family protein n=1 Tax=Butyrivibrio sp. AC2005 TaxID=1280672 RepID=UPI000418A6D9|nr:lecithin retinol acyltransferase family protein [Butyrivibrio sp. AC2005]
MRRQIGYHMYSATETIERAKSRIGETKYNLAFNNCEHFALWCKTGLTESIQVEDFFKRLLTGYAGSYENLEEMLYRA